LAPAVLVLAESVADRTGRVTARRARGSAMSPIGDYSDEIRRGQTAPSKGNPPNRRNTIRIYGDVDCGIPQHGGHGPLETRRHLRIWCRVFHRHAERPGAAALAGDATLCVRRDWRSMCEGGRLVARKSSSTSRRWGTSPAGTIRRVSGIDAHLTGLPGWRGVRVVVITRAGTGAKLHGIKTGGRHVDMVVVPESTPWRWRSCHGGSHGCHGQQRRCRQHEQFLSHRPSMQVCSGGRTRAVCEPNRQEGPGDHRAAPIPWGHNRKRTHRYLLRMEVTRVPSFPYGFRVLRRRKHHDVWS
jgi:hypothetical protein